MTLIIRQFSGSNPPAATIPYADERCRYPKSSCTATLIDSTHALTAAHCFNPMPSFPISITINGASYSVTAVHRNNCWSDSDDGPNGADLAVLVLSSAVTGVTIYPRYTGSDEVGQTLTIIGWGNWGPAGSNPTESTSSSSLKEGTNVIVSTNNNVLSYILDDPGTAGSTATPLEAIGSGGDSGGPIFLTTGSAPSVTYLAGINSGSVNSGGEIYDYGSTDQSVRVSSAW